MATVLEQVFRDEWSRVLANLIRFTGNLDLAEECAQEAFARAAETDLSSIANPGAWLTTVAKRIAVDRMRREATLARKLPLLAEDLDASSLDDQSEEAPPIDDDRLRLTFVACNPELAEEAQVALALRLVCGVATVDIASVFLVPEPTMAARITRAKKKIASSHARFELPSLDKLAERIEAVRTTIYLLYTTLHEVPQSSATSSGVTANAAISMAAQLVALYPDSGKSDDGESAGLHALLLLTEARRPGRVSATGQALALDEVDRSLWDGQLIQQGLAQATRALPGGGRFALQAGISGLHSAAPTWDATPWPEIVSLYERLLAIWPAPSVRLGALIAKSYVSGPKSALSELEELADETPTRQVAAARGDLLRRLGRHHEAIAAYEAAARLEPDPLLQGYLLRRAAEI
ncbi:MAG: DUF6596 domain-containing protein [Aeromicrobium sp.]